MRLLLICLFLTGCATQGPLSGCADRPIYKEYAFSIPSRPNLELINTDKPGLIVRKTEENYSVLIEYTLKLENLINSIPKVSIPDNSVK